MDAPERQKLFIIAFISVIFFYLKQKLWKFFLDWFWAIAVNNNVLKNCLYLFKQKIIFVQYTVILQLTNFSQVILLCRNQPTDFKICTGFYIIATFGWNGLRVVLNSWKGKWLINVPIFLPYFFYNHDTFLFHFIVSRLFLSYSSWTNYNDYLPKIFGCQTG